MWVNIFHQPFPINTWRRYWLRGVGFGGFVFLFLLVFQPFDLNLYAPAQLLFTTGVYGLTTAVVITGGSLLLIKGIAPYINEERWTLGKQILWNTFLMICITFGNVLVTQWMHGMALPVSWYFIMMKWVFMLGILPIGIAELITYNHFLKKNLKSAAEVSDQIRHTKVSTATDFETKIIAYPKPPRKQELAGYSSEKRKQAAALFIDTDLHDTLAFPPPIVKLTGENQGDSLDIVASSILAVQSLDNYVNVFYESNGKLQTAMLRNTLTNIAAQLTSFSNLYRSHRGWLVNTDRVVKVDGNAQGLKLTLVYLSQQVPVSRNNIAAFRQLIGDN
ncbi:MAG: hypothetical protein EOO04_07255 [Chitinophagaceae bacterium]|nr:MAG: hypothetical protein EOO04_07255 [Chitinophagaceae bacterium]